MVDNEGPPKMPGAEQGLHIAAGTVHLLPFKSCRNCPNFQNKKKIMSSTLKLITACSGKATSQNAKDLYSVTEIFLT